MRTDSAKGNARLQVLNGTLEDVLPSLATPQVCTLSNWDLKSADGNLVGVCPPPSTNQEKSHSTSMKLPSDAQETMSYRPATALQIDPKGWPECESP